MLFIEVMYSLFDEIIEIFRKFLLVLVYIEYKNGINNIFSIYKHILLEMREKKYVK